MKNKICTILKELDFVLSKINQDKCDLLINTIIESNKIVCIGAGRVGMITKTFAMRLGHLGLKGWFLGDSTVPGIGKGDLLLVSSGSGETQTIYDLVKIAKEKGCNIALITGNPDSRMGELSNIIVQIDAPSKTKKINGFTSIQPMTTLNEQSLFIFFDTLVLELMEKMNKTNYTMSEEHSILE